MTPIVNAQRRIQSLDGIRAISIALVIFGHLVHTFHAVPKSVTALSSIADLGVRIFFVISGFLITRILLADLDTFGTIRVHTFYFRRVLRILPPYLVFVLIVLAGNTIGWLAINRADLIHSLTFTTNYCRGCTWNLGHTWSLSVEEQFYLVWPIMLFVFGRQRGMLLMALLAVLCPVARLIALQFAFDLVPYRFELAADPIAIGCLVAGMSGWLARHDHVSPRLHPGVFVLLLSGMVGLALLANRPSVIPPPLFVSVGTFVLNLLIALFVYLAITWRGRTNIVIHLLNSRPFVQIGLMSYSIYLWQQIFLNSFAAAWYTQPPFNLLLVVVCSTLSYCLIERPSIRLRSWLERRAFADRPGAAERVDGLSL